MSHPKKAGGQGFEPRLTVPKTVVLPLDDPPSQAQSRPVKFVPGRSKSLAGHDATPQNKQNANRRAFSRCRGPDLNWGHMDFQSIALPTELPRQKTDA